MCGAPRRQLGHAVGQLPPPSETQRLANFGWHFSQATGIRTGLPNVSCRCREHTRFGAWVTPPWDIDGAMRQCAPPFTVGNATGCRIAGTRLSSVSSWPLPQRVGAKTLCAGRFGAKSALAWWGLEYAMRLCWPSRMGDGLVESTHSCHPLAAPPGGRPLSPTLPAPPTGAALCQASVRGRYRSRSRPELAPGRGLKRKAGILNKCVARPRYQ